MSRIRRSEKVLVREVWWLLQGGMSLNIRKRLANDKSISILTGSKTTFKVRGKKRKGKEPQSKVWCVWSIQNVVIHYK